MVTQVLKVRGDGLTDLNKSYGVSYAVSTLAPSAESRLKGLLGRPRFAAGDATNKVVAKSCWEWANSCAEVKGALSDFQLASFAGFKVGEGKDGPVEAVLSQRASEEHDG